jgi:hypothetical protein
VRIQVPAALQLRPGELVDLKFLPAQAAQPADERIADRG